MYERPINLRSVSGDIRTLFAMPKLNPSWKQNRLMQEWLPVCLSLQLLKLSILWDLQALKLKAKLSFWKGTVMV
ncbi:hypothetical protein FGO68_gene1822 [Halteria grandinella]|uniref:Uncharacterized protein n=1 Tax=Halteria grandinella TaxID=5974 RepID=A0A8J8NZ93_HALGN|nr:hypothetical protein FGO68_gene1822 [Halteria grandinella]